MLYYDFIQSWRGCWITAGASTTMSWACCHVERYMISWFCGACFLFNLWWVELLCSFLSGLLLADRIIAHFYFWGVLLQIFRVFNLWCQVIYQNRKATYFASGVSTTFGNCFKMVSDVQELLLNKFRQTIDVELCLFTDFPHKSVSSLEQMFWPIWCSTSLPGGNQDDLPPAPVQQLLSDSMGSSCQRLSMLWILEN